MHRWVEVARRVPPWAGLVAVVVVFNVAVSQPLLDVVGRNPEFLVAHDASPSDVVLFAVILTIVVPLLAGGVVAALVAAHRPVGVLAQLVVVGALAVLLWVQLLDRFLPDLPMAAAVLVLAGATALALTFSQPLRRFLVAGLAVPLASLGLFLFASPASALVNPAADQADEVSLAPENAPPIVFLIFDGLPMASLLGPDGQIDAETFPNFARLAGDATLYRNTTTVHPNTEMAVPALLTGKFPRLAALPITADHPGNLFAVLDDHYAVRAAEPVTQLCPPTCASTDAEPRNASASDVAGDLGIIALHVLLPDSATEGLPAIDDGWRDFAEDGADAAVGVADRFRQGWRDHRGEEFLAAFDEMDDPRRPTLHFSHALLPHTPWEFLPSGQRYPSPPGREGISDKKVWGEDEWLVNQGFQRHLLQTGYVDTLLGRVLDRLDEEGVYDDTLIIVAADHGVGFVPGGPYRRFTSDNFGETAWVPLFMKTPNQRGGAVDDRPVMTIDVVPSVLDAIGADASALDLDGTSVFDIPQDRDRRVPGRRAWPDFDIAFLHAAVQHRHDVFGSTPSRHVAYSLVPDDQYRELLGEAVPAGALGEPAGTTHLDDPWAYAELDPDSPIVPAQVRGRLALRSPLTEPTPLALVVNGRIEAVTLTRSDNEAGGATFSAMVPPDALTAGDNTIEPHLIVNGRFLPVPASDVGTFEAHETEGNLVLRDESGDDIPVTWQQYGVVEEIRHDDSHLIVTGWAGDPVEGTRAEAVVLVADERVVAVTVPRESRRYVGNRFNAPELHTSGFSLSVPRDEISADAELAVVGVGGDRARHIPPVAAIDTGRYRWWTPSQ